MSKFLIRFKLLIFIFICFITLVLIPFAIQVKPNNSVEALSVIDDPALTLMEKLQRLFGNNEFLVVTIEVDSIFAQKNLVLIESLTQDLEKISGIKQVSSLTNLSHIYSRQENGEDILEVGSLIQRKWFESDIPEDDQKRILKTQPFEKLFFDKQGKTAAIFAEFEPLGQNNDKRDQILKEVEEKVLPYRKLVKKVVITGMPVVDRFTFGVIEYERFILTGALIFLSALILWGIYRRWSLVLLPIGLMSAIMIWIMAFIYLTERAFSWILALAPVVILIVSICDSIHIINCYYANHHLPLEERLRCLFKKVGMPCLVTSITTALGFFSIATSRIMPLRDFGIVAGIGVMIAFLISLFVLPLCLSWTQSEPKKKKTKTYSHVLEKVLNKIHFWNTQYTNRILIMSFLFFVVVSAGIFFMPVDEHIFTMHKNSEAKTLFDDVKYISADAAGAGSEFYLYFQPDEDKAFLNPEFLKKLDHYQDRIEKEVDLVFQSMSVVDLLKSLNQAFHNNDPQFYSVPDSREEIAQLFFLYATGEHGDDMNSLVTPDYSEGRVRVFAGISDSAQETDRNIQQAWGFLAEEGLMRYNPSTSGRPLIMINTMFYILDSQILSLLFAFLSITISLIILFRSVKLGLFSLIPNAIPIFMTMGLIGWTPIYLGVGTSMVAAIALGIAVDDTIHILWAYRAQIRLGKTCEEALSYVFQTVGPAVFNTSFILTVGFLGLLISQIRPSTHMGLLLSAACFFALIYDLFLLPTLLLKFKPLKEKA